MICPNCGPKAKVDMLQPAHRCVTCGMEGIVVNCLACGHANVDYWQSDGATRQLVNFCPGCGAELAAMRDQLCADAVAQWPLLKRAYDLFAGLDKLTCVQCEAKSPMEVEGLTAYTRVRPVAQTFTKRDERDPQKLVQYLASVDSPCICEYCDGHGFHDLNVKAKTATPAQRMQSWWNLRGKYINDVAALVAQLETEAAKWNGVKP